MEVRIRLKQKKRAYLGEALDFLKKEKGIRQKEVAARMKESEGALSGKLSGDRGITDDYLDAFMDAYSSEFEDFPLFCPDATGKPAALSTAIGAMQAQMKQDNKQIIEGMQGFKQQLTILGELILARGK